MNQNITDYIQMQMEAAKVERQRQLEALEAEQTRRLAESAAYSIASTLRVLSLMGIEAGESDLAVEGEFVSFSIGNIRIWLKTDKVYKDGDYYNCHHLQDETINYQGKPVHSIRFGLKLKHVLVEWDHSNPRDVEVWEFSEPKIIPTRLPEAVIAKFFQELVGLEEQYAYLTTPKATIEEAQAENDTLEAITPAKPEFVYKGETRESVLAQVMADILKPPNLNCTCCGRPTVHPTDLQCTRCGADYTEGEG